MGDVHLRSPSIDKGVSSFLWALGLGLFLFFGMMAIGVNRGTALVFAALLGLGIFFFVRIAGEERPR